MWAPCRPKNNTVRTVDPEVLGLEYYYPKPSSFNDTLLRRDESAVPGTAFGYSAKRRAVSERFPDSESVLFLAYDAVIRRDFDAFAVSVAADVQLRISGFPPMDGIWHGQDEVVAAMRRVFSMAQVRQLDMESAIKSGDTIVVRLRESGMFKSDGRTYHLRHVQRFTLVDGKVRTIDHVATNVPTAIWVSDGQIGRDVNHI